MQLRRLKARFGKINHIFISHLHGDHIFGLFGLLSSFQLLGRKVPLHIFAPAPLEEILFFYRKTFSPEESYPILHHVIGKRGLKLIHEDKQVEVFSFPLKHRQTTCGFLFREKQADLNFNTEAMARFKPGIAQIQEIKKGKDLLLDDGTVVKNHVLTLPPWKTRSYAFCSDTAFDKSLAKYTRGVDLLYHEATFCNSDAELAAQTMHSTPAQAAEIAALAGAGKLLLGHFSSRYKNVSFLEEEARLVFPNVSAVNDGDVYTVPRIRHSKHPGTG